MKNFLFVSAALVLSGCYTASGGFRWEPEDPREVREEDSAEGRRGEPNEPGVNWSGSGINGPTAGEVASAAATVNLSGAQAHAVEVTSDAQANLTNAYADIVREGGVGMMGVAAPLGLGMTNTSSPLNIAYISGFSCPDCGARRVHIQNRTQFCVRVRMDGRGLLMFLGGRLEDCGGDPYYLPPGEGADFYTPLDRAGRDGCEEHRFDFDAFLPPVSFGTPVSGQPIPASKRTHFCATWPSQEVEIGPLCFRGIYC